MDSNRPHFGVRQRRTSVERVTAWTALEEAADALRRLNRAVSGFHGDEADLAEVVRVAGALATRLEAGRPRLKVDDVAGLSPVERGETGPVLAVGDRLEFDPFSIGGGRLHPASIGLELHRSGDAAVTARATVDPMFQGPPGRVHGGVVALLVDEVMGAVNRVLGRRAYTARLTVNLRGAAPVGEPLEITAWLHDVVDRKVTLRAQGRSAEGIFVDAEALFVAPREPV